MAEMNTERASLRWALALVCVCATSWACNPTPGEGEFDATSLSLSGCEEEILPWEPGFFTIDQFEGKTTIRLQSIGGAIDTIDGIYIQVDDAFVDDKNADGMPLGDPVLREALLDQGIVVPGRLEDEPEGGVARGVMSFYETCPEAKVVPEMIGRLRFTSFNAINGGQITGFITAPVVVDTRTGNVIGENLSGRFSFQVQKGRPYTNFTGPGNQTP